MGKRRHTGTLWTVGLLCWSALAAASAAAAVVLAFPGRPATELSVDIVRSPASNDGHWKLQPVSAHAAQLFFASGKGPRADFDADSPGDGDSTSANRIELASLSGEATEVVSPGQGRAIDLKSLKVPARRAEEKICLSEVIYYEGRGQPIEAQIAVGQTVINRALSGAYPSTLCGTAHQHGSRSDDCQYSFACDQFSGIAKDRADWELAQELAERLISGAVWLPDIGDATHSHPLAEHPAWAKYLQRVKRIGALVFYRGDFSAASAKATATD